MDQLTLQILQLLVLFQLWYIMIWLYTSHVKMVKKHFLMDLEDSDSSNYNDIYNKYTIKLRAVDWYAIQF